MATQPESPARPPAKSRMWIIVVVVIVLAVFIGLRSLAGPPSHEGQGTITAIDLTARRATVEAIDPANGNRRDYIGTVAPDCAITIDDKPAKLEDLKVGDLVRVRVHSDRKAEKINGKRPMVAEMIKVTRKEGKPA
ncbi:MAG TPA: hypothetical protein VMV94_06930 [Phycisphaerae bacterium]|nr:hypothetical protein [Phycisphaerae bacterium]